MQRVIITVKGRVQRTNYRDQVEEIARKLNITGYVKNLKPYDVRIVAEGDEKSIKTFIEQINIRKFPVFVENLKIKPGHATGEFEYFEIKRGKWQDELGERLDTAGKLLYRSLDVSERSLDVSERSLEVGEESVKIGRTMLDKQDQMLDKLDSFHHDTVQKFDTMDVKYDKVSDKLDKMDKTLDKLANAILKLAEKTG